jgi:shikimate dehydrogenase
MAEQKVLGVLGFPVEHSKSPDLFQQLFRKSSLSNWDYQKFSFESLSDFFTFLQANTAVVGFNVTIPYKQTIMPFLHFIDPLASRIGAVNTVKLQYHDREDGTGTELHLSGFNTDYFGFFETVKSLPKMPKKALILGTGGASKAVICVLEDLQIPYTLFSRKPQNDQIQEYQNLGSYLNSTDLLVVNTTPVGMSGFAFTELPIAIDCFPIDTQVIDLIYNPPTTKLLEKCRAKGLTCVNGWHMLQKQAEKAWEIFKN